MKTMGRGKMGLNSKRHLSLLCFSLFAQLQAWITKPGAGNYESLKKIHELPWPSPKLDLLHQVYRCYNVLKWQEACAQQGV